MRPNTARNRSGFDSWSCTYRERESESERERERGRERERETERDRVSKEDMGRGRERARARDRGRERADRESERERERERRGARVSVFLCLSPCLPHAAFAFDSRLSCNSGNELPGYSITHRLAQSSEGSEVIACQNETTQSRALNPLKPMYRV